MRRLLVLARLGLPLAALVLAHATDARAQSTHALVVGIDRYLDPNLRLAGAANDARDIADALRSIGVRRVTTLIDAEASRDRLLGAWEQLVATAARGDTVVLAFSGHGGREPERVRGSEKSGYDQTLIMTGFYSFAPFNHDRIFDDEIGDLFAEAGRRGLRVVFVADACYSGTMTRSADPRAARARTRTVGQYVITDDALPPPVSQGPASDEEQPHVVYFSGSLDNELISEVEIDGKTRGALSWSFAAALRGGRVTLDDMRPFVLQNVRQLVESKQHADIRAGKAIAARDTLFPGTTPRPPPAALATVAAAAPPMRLAITGGDVGAREALFKELRGVRPAAAGERPELVWDTAARQAIHELGDIVARDVTPRSMQGVIDKWATVNAVRGLGSSVPLTTRLSPSDGFHAAGRILTLDVSGARFVNWVVFSLAADGTINWFDPALGTRTVGGPSGATLGLTLRAEAPFGADHIVAIASQQPLTELNARLRALDGRPSASQALTLLVEWLPRTDYQLGLQGLYTMP